MALVTKPDLQRDLGEGQIGLSEKLFRSFQPPLYQIEMRRRSYRLFERSSKMPLRQAGDVGKSFQFDILTQMLLNIFAYALQSSGCQATN